MAFANDDIKEQARKLLKQGKQPKEIVEALQGQCKAQDVTNLKYSMKKSASGGKKKKAQVKSDTGFRDAPPIVGILIAEQSRLRERASLLEAVLDVYGDVKKESPFKSAMEEEIDRTNERLNAITELLDGYDDAIPLKIR